MRPEIQDDDYYPGKFTTEAINTHTSRGFHLKRLAVAASPWMVYMAIAGYLGPAILPTYIFTGLCSGLAAEMYEGGILSATAINFGAYLVSLIVLSVLTRGQAGDAGLGFAIAAILMFTSVPAAALGALFGRLARAAYAKIFPK